MANKQNAFIFRTTVRAGWLLAALALLPIAASAKGYSPAVAGSTVAWTNSAIGKAQLSSAAAGVVVTAPVSFSVAAGALVPAIVSGTIAGAQFAGAWGAAIGAIGAVAIYAIPEINASMQRAGIKAKADGTLTGPDPDACSTAPCYQYLASYSGPKASTSGVWKSRAGACSEYISVLATNNPDYGYVGNDRPVSGGQCWFTSSAYGGDSRITMDERQVAPSSGSSVPVTFQYAQEKLSAQAPTAQEVQALVDANFPPVVTPQAITGPASIAGANTVKLGLDGASQTETCKYFVEYFPSNIKAHPECTTVTSIPEKTESKTVTTTNPDGTTSTSVISTKTPATSKTETTTKDAVENKDKSECEQYPNRVGCAELDVPSGEIPKITKSVGYREETLFGSGSCPADLSANIGTLHQTVKIWDWQKTCEMALPLRALVLSLATFAALLIIMPGGAKS